MEDRKAAAEARRAKLLARGGDRLAKITGTLSEPVPAKGPPPASTASQQTAPASLSPASAAAAAAAVPSPAVPPSAAAALAAELAGAVKKSSSSQDLSQARKAAGTATNGKWAQYKGPSATSRPRQRLRAVGAGETVSAAVLSTSRLRLLLAVLLAVLLAARWDAVAARSAASAAATASSKLTAPQAGGPSTWVELKTLLGAKLAAAGLPTWIGAAESPQIQLAAAPGTAAHRRQLLRGMLDRVRGQVAAASKAAAAASPEASSGSSTALQRVGRHLLSIAASTPPGKAAAAVLSTLHRHYSAAAATPAGQEAAAAARRAHAAMAAAAASLHSQLAAAWSSPAVERGLAAAEKLPPLALLLLLDLSLIGAAAAALVAAPSLVHSTLELELQTPGVLSQVAALVPGLTQQLSLVAAWHRLLNSLFDNAAAFVVALVAYGMLPQLLEAGERWLAAAPQ